MANVTDVSQLRVQLHSATIFVEVIQPDTLFVDYVQTVNMLEPGWPRRTASPVHPGKPTEQQIIIINMAEVNDRTSMIQKCICHFH